MLPLPNQTQFCKKWIVQKDLSKSINCLGPRQSTPMSVLLESLEVSRATIKRDLTYMRDRL